MKHLKTSTTSKFSWLAYGSLSLSMLVIAAVSVTVGQDEGMGGGFEQEQLCPGIDVGGMGGMGMGGMGMGWPSFEFAAPSANLTEFKRNKSKVQRYLESAIVSTLNPRQSQRMSRKGSRPQMYRYAIKLNVDEEPLENLIRFEVARTKNVREKSSDAEPSNPQLATIVGSGVLLVDSAKIYMDSPTKEGKLKLSPLNRQHLVEIENFKTKLVGEPESSDESPKE